MVVLLQIIHLQLQSWNPTPKREEKTKNMWKKNFTDVTQTFIHRWINHQLKLMDSKCIFSAKPDEQIVATSCLIFFGPLTRTPTLDPLHSNSISASKSNDVLARKQPINNDKWFLLICNESFLVIRNHSLVHVSNCDSEPVHAVWFWLHSFISTE